MIIKLLLTICASILFSNNLIFSQKYNLYDFDGNIINIDTLENIQVVLIAWKTPNCKECFQKLSSYFRGKDNIKVYIISQTSSKFFEKRTVNKYIYSVYEGGDVIYEHSDNEKNQLISLFNKYSVEQTPEIIYFNDRKVKHISFSEMFGNNKDYKVVLDYLFKEKD